MMRTLQWYDAQEADDDEAQVDALQQKTRQQESANGQQEANKQEANQQELTHADYKLRSAIDAQVRMVCGDIPAQRGRWAEAQ